MKKLLSIVISVFLLLFFFNSCNKNSLSSKNTVPFIAKNKLSQKYLENQFFKSLDIKKAIIVFETLEKTTRLNSRIKILKDSIIQLSIKPGLGIEAFRVNFTSDSIFIINRLDKKIYLLDYHYIRNNYGVTIGFDELQKIILGESFSFVHLDGKKDFSLKRTENYELLFLNLEFSETDKFDVNLNYLGKDLISKKVNNSFHVKNYKFKNWGNIVAPEHIEVTLRTNAYSSKLRIVYKEIFEKENLNCSLRYSSKYTKFRLFGKNEN